MTLLILRLLMNPKLGHVAVQTQALPRPQPGSPTGPHDLKSAAAAPPPRGSLVELTV